MVPGTIPKSLPPPLLLASEGCLLPCLLYLPALSWNFFHHLLKSLSLLGLKGSVKASLLEAVLLEKDSRSLRNEVDLPSIRCLATQGKVPALLA